MAFDIFFQGFAHGGPAEGGGDEMRLVLDDAVVGQGPGQYLAIKVAGGTADVYLGRSSMLVNRIDGEAVWDLLVSGARAARWVIIPAGCPVCIGDEAQRAHLPDALGDDVRVVTCGADVLAAIGSV